MKYTTWSAAGVQPIHWELEREGAYRLKMG